MDLANHRSSLRRLARALVRSDDQAEDLVHDTFVVALRRPPETDRPVGPWLAEVLRNVLRMRMRADRRRLRREELAQVTVEPVCPPEELADAQLAEMVERLDEPYRSTVVLRYYDGLSSAEIARRQAVNAATVRWRLKEGLDRLRAQLDRHERARRRAIPAMLLAAAVVLGCLYAALIHHEPRHRPLVVNSATPVTPASALQRCV